MWIISLVHAKGWGGQQHIQLLSGERREKMNKRRWDKSDLGTAVSPGARDAKWTGRGNVDDSWKIAGQLVLC